MHRYPLFAVLLTGSLALAQTTIYVPDNQAAVGTCNAIPLDSTFGVASTYVGRIPASFLGTSPFQIQDVQFAPCNTTVFTATNMQMGIGHLPTPAPNPLVFPTFDAGGNMTALGSFLDYTPAYNSVVQGPFSYTMTANTWCSLGFAATGGTHFSWNGVNDIGFYLTWSAATGGGPCHRTATEPYRFYNSGVYQAPSSNGSGAAGLKMGLVTGWPVVCAGCGPLTMSVVGTSSLGGSLTSTVGNAAPGLPFVGLGFGPFCIAPLCPGCTIGHSWAAVIFGNTATLNIPNNQIYLGIQVGFQGAGLLTPGGCATPMVALSDTVVVTITP
jgi:hypothetical protein